MSISLDPMRLRFLLERLHKEFPSVDYGCLVREVMQAERTTSPDETLEAYRNRVRQSVLATQPAAGALPHCRPAKIICKREREPEFALMED